jgi:Glycosyl hydrolase family 99
LRVAALLALVVPLAGGAGEVHLPARAAFYYAWYPEVWVYNGHHVHDFHPTMGYYHSDSRTVVDEHIKALDYGKFDVAIVSWQGKNRFSEQTRIPLLFDRTAALRSRLKWALYYEKEGFGNPSDAEIASDLAYIKSRYTRRQQYAKVDGKPVLFVYNADDMSCSVANRWVRLAASDFYLVLKAIPSFDSCPAQPDAWHQYGHRLYNGGEQLLFFLVLIGGVGGWNAVLFGIFGRVSSASVGPIAAGLLLVGVFVVVGTHLRDRPPVGGQSVGDSYVIAPGFWRADEDSPRLVRDPDRFARNVRDMVASGKPWQLVTAFNEWGEGWAVEDAAEWSTRSGFGRYLDILHQDGRGR